MLRNVYRKWIERSKSNPIVFNCVNAFILFGSGDLIQQKLGVNEYLDNLGKDEFSENLEDHLVGNEPPVPREFDLH